MFTSPVIDDFNRASLGSNWTGIADFPNDMAIFSNQLGSSTSTSTAIYWNVSTFAADQEIYVDLPTLPGSAGGVATLYARITGTNTFTFDSYVLYLTNNGGVIDMTLARVDDGGLGAVLGNSGTITFNAGDSYGMRCVGTEISAWRRPSGGAWTQVMAFTDATYNNAGHIAIGCISSIVRMDNAGFGTIRKARPPVRRRTRFFVGR